MGSQRQLLRMLQSKKCNDQGLEWHPSSECTHQAALFNKYARFGYPQRGGALSPAMEGAPFHATQAVNERCQPRNDRSLPDESDDVYTWEE